MKRIFKNKKKVDPDVVDFKASLNQCYLIEGERFIVNSISWSSPPKEIWVNFISEKDAGTKHHTAGFYY